jgi:hypothetical protein
VVAVSFSALYFIDFIVEILGILILDYFGSIQYYIKAPEDDS